MKQQTLVDQRDHPDLVEIIAEFDRTTPLDASTVRRWMTTDDIEAAGALMSLLANPKQDSRINPPLRPEEYFEFVRRYYERSMLENPDGEWADSTTTAGYDFARWFQRLWDDPASKISNERSKDILGASLFSRTRHSSKEHYQFRVGAALPRLRNTELLLRLETGCAFAGCL